MGVITHRLNASKTSKLGDPWEGVRTEEGGKGATEPEE